MTDRDKIIRLATEVMGWKARALSEGRVEVWKKPCMIVSRWVPWNPLESIADAYEMERAIPETQRADYLGHLECACVPVGKFHPLYPMHIWALVHATPRQRCDAAIAMLEGR